MLWTVGNVSKNATRAKWAQGALPALPLIILVPGACCVGLAMGTRHMMSNPSVEVAKATRGIDLTEPRAAKAVAREGAGFHDSAWRTYLKSKFFTGAAGTLDNSEPFLMRSAYGAKKA